jgi:HlyD family secretion protein
MTNTNPKLVVTGAAMDVAAPKRKRNWKVIVPIAVCVVSISAYLMWQFMPHGLQVARIDVRIASAERGVFLDNLVVRVNAIPMNSVLLDSIESGRVEEVIARDGMIVKQGDLLFRLSNPQRSLELMQRQSEYAQQISNMSNLNVASETSHGEHERRMAAINYALDQAEKTFARNQSLAAHQFISGVVLQQSADELANQRALKRKEQENYAAESKVRKDSSEQLLRAIASLESGLTLVRATVNALAVQAPTAGRLTDFNLQVGQTVKTDQPIGRIDDPDHFKLSAQVDEFYLARIALGTSGTVAVNGQNYPMKIGRIFPQIKDGRFSVELVFTGSQPDNLRPGQSLDATINLGASLPALVLPNGAFMNESGGTYVFVVGHGGKGAERRPVRLGRRSNSQVEVLSGLEAGEKVIVSSYTPFKTATRLQLTD